MFSFPYFYTINMAQIGILRLKKIVDSLLDFVKADYEYNLNNIIDDGINPEHNTVGESFLFRCIDSDDEIEGISYQQLAVEIFTRDDLENRKVETRLMFDPDRAVLPTIHLREPAKGKGHTDGIGYIGDFIYENEDGSFQEARKRSFASQYEFLITSANRHEVIIMEEVLLGLFIGAQDTLALYHPFYSFQFSVKELMANNELVPRPLFIKSISVNTSFEKAYPDLSKNLMLGKILFNHQILSE